MGWLELSSPARDRPLVPAVERIARHLRRGASELEESVSLDFESLYAPSRPGLGFTLPETERARRSAWVLLGEWLVAWAAGHHDGTATIGDTHAWFWEGRQVGDLGEVASRRAIPTAITNAAEVWALLPYLLDTASIATRRSVMSAQANQAERVERKKAGAYYTPGDVAVHMVRRLSATGGSPSTWFDPAQGSGVFLRAALSLADDYDTARNNLYGVDIDPFAAEATSFVLVAEDLIANPGAELPWQRWHRFRRNLATGNSLFINAAERWSKDDGLYDEVGSWTIGSVFPEVTSGRFSRIIANPPYVKLAPHPANRWLGQLHPITGAAASADISPVFVELGLDLLAPDGAMSVVLPLSAVVSTRAPFPQLRSRLATDGGRVGFESFDRVPDALFGDDIKTRNSIITIERSAPADVTSTPLHRWTSRKRDLAFSSAPSVSVAGLTGVPAVLPKIGHPWERELFEACTDHPASLASWVWSRRSMSLGQLPVVDNSHWAQTVALAPTAYNFLGVTRDATQAGRDGHNSENAVAIFGFESARRASAAYAILASRFAFWLWHVTGDGFHTTAKLPLYVPAARNDVTAERLADLGEELWDLARQQPLVSVNRGRTTVSYPTWVLGQKIDQIDREVDAMLGTDFAGRLAKWHERLVVVDVESERVEKVLRKTL